MSGVRARAAVRVANEDPSKRASVDQQTVGRMRRIRKAAARKAERDDRTMPEQEVGAGMNGYGQV